MEDRKQRPELLVKSDTSDTYNVLVCTNLICERHNLS